VRRDGSFINKANTFCRFEGEDENKGKETYLRKSQ